MAVAFSPDGRSLAASGTDLATRVWEIVPPQIVSDAGWSAAERLALRRDAGTAVDVTFSPDGRYLAEAGDDGTARVWLVADGGAAEPALTPGNLVAAIAGHTGPVWSAGFVRQCAGANDVPGEPCQQRLVTAGQDGAIYLWEPATGRFAGSLAGHPAAAFDVAFAPSGTLLASAGQDNTVKLWSIPADVVKPGDAFSVTLTATLAGHTGWVRSLAFSRDGTRVATGSDDTTARIWDPRTGQALLTLAGHRGPVAGVAFSPDGRRLATASWDKTARVWDAATGDLLATLTGHAGAVNSVAFSPDGTKLVTASDDTTVKVWDSTTGDGLATLDGHANEVNDAVFDDGGNVIASAGRDMTVRLWDAASGQELDTLSGHADTIFGLAMSGRELASASGDRTARVWRLPVGYGTATQVGTVDEELRLAGNQASILGVAFSPDRRRLATAAIDGAVNVYSLGPSEEVVTLVDHRQEILSLGVSADGKRLATSTADGVVTVWDGDTGAELLALNDPGGGWIWDVSLSSTCDAAAEANAARCRPRMATAGSDGTTRVWDAATGEELLDLKGHRGAVRGVAYSPDNTRLATTGDDGTARLWDAETGEERFTLADHPGPVVGGGFSGDGTKLGTVSFDSQAGRYQVRIWDLATGTELAAPACQAAGDEVFTLSTDFTRLAIGKPDGRIVLCAAATGETIWEAGGGLERVAAFDFSRDDTRLLAVAQGRGKMFDVATGQVVLDFPLPVTAPWFAGLTGLQDGSSQRVVVAGLDGPATVWQLPPGAGGDGQAVVERATIVPDPAAVTAVAESPDQGLLAAASANRTVKLWDTSSYQALATLAGHALAISSVAFAPACAGRPDATANVCETTRMATAGDDGKVVVWSLRPAPEAAGPRLVASEVLTLTGHAGGTTSVAFSPDGARLATVGGDAMVRLWDAATGAALGALAGHGDVVRSVTFSPNGERVATASWDGTARLWDAATGQQILMVEDRGRGLEDVAFSPDGAQLATADADGIAKIWSVESGQELQTLLGHVGAVLSLAYSPDGRRLASAGDDGTIRLWNPLTGEQEMVLPAEGPVRDVAFSPDGRRLIAGGTDGAVRVYALDAKELQSLAGRRVARPPTVQECQKYLRQQVCPAPGVTTTPVVAP